MICLKKSDWHFHEFFAGSGLVALGLDGLFSPVWSNDIDTKKANVYSLNLDNSHLLVDDIKNVKGDALPEVELSWASFPCQDLSLAGKIGGINAERSGLVWEWLRIIEEMHTRPKILAIENVVGLISTHGGQNYIALHKALNELGYRAGAVLINADRFVPQSRPRVFVIAVEKSVTIPEGLQSSSPSWWHTDNMKAFSSLDGWIWWTAPEPKKRVIHLKDVLEDVPFDKDHVLKLLSERHREQLDKLDEFQGTAYRRTRNGRQCVEVRFDDVAGCLRTPKGGSSKQLVVVKKNGETHARLLTARELTRLMGAPDSYMVPDSYMDAYYAMGDAVAVPVVRYLGQNILKPLADCVYAK